MAFLCPVRIRRSKKKHGGHHQLDSDLLTSNGLSRQPLPNMGRITGSASIETLVRVGIEKEHGLSPDSKMIVLHDFMPCVDDELEVHRGQVVNVLYQENDWVYVISENQQHEGFIPYSYCAPLESHLDNLLTYKKKMPRSGGGPGSVISGSVVGANTAAEGISVNVNDDSSSSMITSQNILNGATNETGSGGAIGTLKISNHSNGSNFDGGTSGVGTAVTGDNDALSSYLMPNITSINGLDLNGTGGVVGGDPNNNANLANNNDFGSQVAGSVGRATTPHNNKPNCASYQLESMSQSLNYHNSMLNIDTVSNPNGITSGGGSCVGAAPSIVSACSNGARSNLSNHHSKNKSHQNGHYNSNTLNTRVSASSHHGSAVPNTYHHLYGTLNRAKSNLLHHSYPQQQQFQQCQQPPQQNPNASQSPTSSALRNLDIYFANTYNQMPINLKDGTASRNRLPLHHGQQAQQSAQTILTQSLGELQPFFKDSSGHYIVLYTFLAREENDVSVERGEVVTVLNKDDPNWFWIVRSDSQEGFVPAIFICPADMLINVHHSNQQQQQQQHQQYSPPNNPSQHQSFGQQQQQQQFHSHHPHHHHRSSSIHFSNSDASNPITIPTNNNQTAAIFH